MSVANQKQKHDCNWVNFKATTSEKNTAATTSNTESFVFVMSGDVTLVCILNLRALATHQLLSIVKKTNGVEGLHMSEYGT